MNIAIFVSGSGTNCENLIKYFTDSESVHCALVVSNKPDAYPHRIINIHPALLPKYGGKGMWGHHVHEAVKAAGETETGMTVHWVTPDADGGSWPGCFRNFDQGVYAIIYNACHLAILSQGENDPYQFIRGFDD